MWGSLAGGVVVEVGFGVEIRLGRQQVPQFEVGIGSEHGGLKFGREHFLAAGLNHAGRALQGRGEIVEGDTVAESVEQGRAVAGRTGRC